MSETVGQHSVAAFTSPVNGTSPIDANTVKGNDNTLRSAYVDHDADPGIHVQSSTLASRPVANSAGRKWMTQDSGVIRLFYDDGTNWYEIDYLRTTGGTISGNLAITGTLAVTGVATFTAQPILSSLTASRAVFTDGSKGLVSNAITGTGDVVMSASPTLTGTITAAAATLSGTLGVSGLLTFASLKGTGSTTVTDILNDSTMATASATTLATSSSIKTYVDNKVATVDTLAEVLANGNTTGANDIIVSAGQKIRTPAVAAQDGSSAITIANTTGALTLATALADSNLATISTAGKVANSATTATNANTASAIVARDASGNFSAGTITATLNGAAPAGSLTGTTLASNVVTSSLTAVGTIATGVWQGTAISDTYLATISTAGKVSNSATTATSANTASAIVARDASGNFTAGTITATLSGAAPAGSLSGTTLASNVVSSSLTSVGTLANLTVTNPITGSVTGSSGSTTGNAATATALQTARNINGVSFNGTADITVTAAAGTLTGTTLASGVTASSLTSVGTLSSLTVSGDLTVDTNTLKVDSTNNRVGIGTASPGSPLDVIRASTSTIALNEPQIRAINTAAATLNQRVDIAMRWEDGTYNGTGGISMVRESATARNGALVFSSINSSGDATQAMRLDASGNLGIGRTPSGYTLDITTGGNALRMERGGVEMGGFISSGNPFWGTLTNHPFLLITNGSERARITSVGELCVGTTGTNASERLIVRGVGSTNATYITVFENSSGGRAFSIEGAGRIDTGTLGDSPYNYVVGATNRDLYVDNTGKLGYVSSVLASKTNIAPVTDADWLLDLNPVTFNFRKKDEDGNYTDEADGPLKHGLIAEEVEAVNPDLCFYDDEASGGALRGVNYTHLITPMLKLVQAQQAKIESLEARLAALES